MTEPAASTGGGPADAAAPPPVVMSIVTTCKGRLAHLRQTLPRMVAQPGVETIVVDYDCPEGTGDWVAAHFPAVRVIRVKDAPVFRSPHAHNLGARAARGHWLCFVDADVLLAPDFCARMQPLLQPGAYYPMGSAGPQAVGSNICARADWLAVEGYDEIRENFGGDDRDFYLSLARLGRQERGVPPGWVSVIEHGDAERTRHYRIKDRELSQRVNALYVQVKHDLALQLGCINPPAGVRSAIYAEVQRTVLAAAAAGKPACRFEVNLPDALATWPIGGWQMRRTWTYFIDPPAPATAPSVAKTEWWAS